MWLKNRKDLNLEELTSRAGFFESHINALLPAASGLTDHYEGSAREKSTPSAIHPTVFWRRARRAHPRSLCAAKSHSLWFWIGSHAVYGKATHPKAPGAA